MDHYPCSVRGIFSLNVPHERIVELAVYRIAAVIHFLKPPKLLVGAIVCVDLNHLIGNGVAVLDLDDILGLF